MPSVTNITALSPGIAFTGMYVTPASKVAQDFTNPVSYSVFAADGSSKVYNVTVSVANGINSVDGFENVQVFPNPANGELQISNATFPIEKIELIDVIGRVVLTQNPKGIAKSCTVNVSSLPNGFYFLQLENGMNKKVFKVSVMH